MIQTNQHTEDTHTAKDTDTHSDLLTQKHSETRTLTQTQTDRATQAHKHTHTHTKHKHLMVTTVLHGLSKPCRAPRHCLRGPHNTPHNKKRSKRVCDCEECRLRPSLCTLDNRSTSRVCMCTNKDEYECVSNSTFIHSYRRYYFNEYLRVPTPTPTPPRIVLSGVGVRKGLQHFYRGITWLLR